MPLNGKIDLRSDTFTHPTPEMRKAMAESIVGDDVWEMDPTVKELEEYAANLFGKQAALFMPSSCMANLAAVVAHTTGRGEETLVGDRSHISLYEQGNVSTIGGVHVRTLNNMDDGTFDLNELEIKIRPPDNVHFPKTSLVCIETSHNMCSGSAVPVEFIEKVHALVAPKGIQLHIDGARVLNSATALGISPAEYVAKADSIACCLSKGLAAPIGALLIGSVELIKKARHLRKALGGGMRQVGVIACCGLIALRDMSKRLHEDHANAKRLYDGISKIEGVICGKPDTNIVKFSLDSSLYKNANLSAITKIFEHENVYMITVDEGRSIRGVLHYHITSEDVDQAVRVVDKVLRGIREGSISVTTSNERLY
jgi:threonine aldolase